MMWKSCETYSGPRVTEILYLQMAKQSILIDPFYLLALPAVLVVF